jgi:catechol 2,3-dioxygenase-like lactoylglutathione lyase family enzyme
MSVHFENSAPIFRVDDMDASLHFYVNLLGFTNAEWGDSEFTCISRDDASIYLCKQDQGKGSAWAWIGVEDTAQLHQEFLANGVTGVRMPPKNFPWALEMHVEDPDGNVMRFGSDPLPEVQD